jgi:hypothetical protein
MNTAFKMYQIADLFFCIIVQSILLAFIGILYIHRVNNNSNDNENEMDLQFMDPMARKAYRHINKKFKLY